MAEEGGQEAETASLARGGASPFPRRLPWSQCHFRGQDLLAVGVADAVLVIEAASLLLLQRLEQPQVMMMVNDHDNDL